MTPCIVYAMYVTTSWCLSVPFRLLVMVTFLCFKAFSCVLRKLMYLNVYFMCHKIQHVTFLAGFYWVNTRGWGSTLFVSYTSSDTPYLSKCYTHNSLAHFTISSNLNRRLVYSKTLLYFRLFGHIKMHARLLTEVLSSGSSPQTCLLSAPHSSRSLLCVESVCHVCLVSQRYTVQGVE